MKRLIIIFFLFFFSIPFIHAQTTTDIGVIGGASYYMGDINHKKQFYSPGPAYGGILRYNINPRHSVRITVMQATVSGNDLDFDNAFQQARKHSFESHLTEISGVFEFNFFEYTAYQDYKDITPVVNAGISFTVIQEQTSIPKLALPFGLGFRFRISDYLSAGFDWGFRKTFTDDIDNLKAPYFGESSIYYQKQKNYTHSDDWYSYGAFFLTFTIDGTRGECHAYGKQIPKP